MHPITRTHLTGIRGRTRRPALALDRHPRVRVLVDTVARPDEVRVGRAPDLHARLKEPEGRILNPRPKPTRRRANVSRDPDTDLPGRLRAKHRDAPHHRLIHMGQVDADSIRPRHL